MRRVTRRWLLVGALAMWTSIGTALGGCQDPDAVRESDLEEFHALLDHGLSYRADPFVRAETLHVLERMRAPEFTSRAEARLEDGNPMVRVAAIRALLASGHPKANSHAVSQFSGAKTSAKRALLQAVLDYSSESSKRDLLWKAVQPREPASVRYYAFTAGLVPRVEQAMESGNESFVRKLFLPNVNRYVEDLDTELGGHILRLMLRFGETKRAKSVIEEFVDRSNSIDRRLKAARILIEAGAETARPAYKRILERAQVEPNHGRLRVPEKQIDKRLVRAAVLGMVSTGDEAFVSDAKDYMKDASTHQYIQTLKALAHNPKESARLALETALRDARPNVRGTAIRLYSRREDANLGLLLDVHGGENFKRGSAETRYTIARALAQRSSNEWVDELKGRLTSDAGILPALQVLENVVSQTGDTSPLVEVRDDLVRIAQSDHKEAIPLAGYLLVQLPDGKQTEKINKIIRGIDAPMTRYAYLGHLRTHSPEDHTNFLLKNLYVEGDSPELYGIRLMSGAALWRAKNPPKNRPSSKGEDNPEVAAQ